MSWEEKLLTPNVLASATGSKCCFGGCERTSDAVLGGERLCRDHILSICGDQIDSAAGVFKGISRRNIDFASAGRILIECAEAVTELMRTVSDLTPFEQAAAMNSLLQIESISQLLRKYVLLRRDLLRSWEEHAEVEDFCRAGAVLKCSQPTEVGEMLTMTRADTGQTTKVRVLLSVPKKGYYEIVVCFADRDNFWN